MDALNSQGIKKINLIKINNLPIFQVNYMYSVYSRYDIANIRRYVDHLLAIGANLMDANLQTVFRHGRLSHLVVELLICLVFAMFTMSIT
jgi:hypothetical protein